MPPRQALTATFSLALLCLTLEVPGAVPLAYARGTAENSELKQSRIHWWTVNDELSQALVTQNIGTLAQSALTAPAPSTPQAWLYRLALLLRADYPKETLQFLTTRPSFLDAKTDWGLGSTISQAGKYQNFAVAKRLSELFPEAPGATEWFSDWAKIVPYPEADAWLARQGSQGNGAWLDLRIRWRHDRAPGTEQVLLKPLKQAVHQNPDDIIKLLRYVNVVPMSEGSEKTKWLAATLRPRLAVQCFLLADMSAIPGYVKVALYERSLRLPFTKRDVTYYTEYQHKYPRGYDGLAYSRNDVEVEITEQKLRTGTKINLLELYQQNNEPQKVQRLREQLEKDNGAGKRYIASIRRELDAAATTEEYRHSPKSPDYWMERSRYYREVGRKGATVAAFQKAMALTPTSAADPAAVAKRGEVIQAYADYLLYEGFFESQSHPAAPRIAEYEKAMALASYDPTPEGYNVRDLVIGAYTEHFERQSPAAGFAYVRKQLEALSGTSVSPTPSARSENLISALLSLSDENYYRSHPRRCYELHELVLADFRSFWCEN